MVVVGYGTNEDGEERERFWNDLDRIVDRVGNWYRLCEERSEWMDWRKGECQYNRNFWNSRGQ